MASNNNNPPTRTIAGSPLGNPAMSSPASAAAATHLPHLRPPPSQPQPQPQPPPSSASPFHRLFHPQPRQFQIHHPSQSQNPSAAKRPPQKPPARPPAPTAFKSADLTPAARSKRRKPPENQIPDRVAPLLPESALYTQLLEFESRVDAALARKKLDIQESLKSSPSVQRTLRIYVFNTFANPADPPSWSLKIVGRILDDAADPTKPNPMHPKFSSFFKRITIALDPNLYPENPTIVWEQARSPAPQEGFEVKRKGDKEFTASIRLEMNYSPDKFKLSPALTEVLGIEADTRARIIAGIWHYVKARRLQNPTDPAFFACDPPLKKVFGEDRMKFSMVSQKISQHLTLPQPIHLEHKIRLSGNGTVGSACYDVLVDVPFPLQKEISSFLTNAERNKEIGTYDEMISASIKKIHEHRRRRAFFLGFSQSPVEFINALIVSQSRDLKLTAGEANRNAEMEHRSEFYTQPWVEDAVIRYMNRKPTEGNDPPGST